MSEIYEGKSAETKGAESTKEPNAETKEIGTAATPTDEPIKEKENRGIRSKSKSEPIKELNKSSESGESDSPEKSEDEPKPKEWELPEWTMKHGVNYSTAPDREYCFIPKTTERRGGILDVMYPWQNQLCVEELLLAEQVFLPCVCGTNPRVYLYSNLTYSVFCPKCRITTDRQIDMSTAREVWNNHSKHGEWNKGIKIHKQGIHYTDLPDTGKSHWKGREPYSIPVKINEEDMGLDEYYFDYDFRYLLKCRRMLKRGQEFKSYEDLAGYLYERAEVTQSNIQRHKKWWKRFFEFHGKRGVSKTKIKILRVKTEPDPWSGMIENPNAYRKPEFFRPRLYIEELSKEEIKMLNDHERRMVPSKEEREALKEERRLKSLKKEELAQELAEKYGYEIYEDDETFYEDGELSINELENAGESYEDMTNYINELKRIKKDSNNGEETDEEDYMSYLIEFDDKEDEFEW